MVCMGILAALGLVGVLLGGLAALRPRGGPAQPTAPVAAPNRPPVASRYRPASRTRQLAGPSRRPSRHATVYRQAQRHAGHALARR